MSANKDIKSNGHACSRPWLAWQIIPLTLPPKAAILIDAGAKVNVAFVCVCVCVFKPTVVFIAVTFLVCTQLVSIPIKNGNVVWDDNGVDA